MNTIHVTIEVHDPNQPGDPAIVLDIGSSDGFSPTDAEIRSLAEDLRDSSFVAAWKENASASEEPVRISSITMTGDRHIDLEES